MGALGLGAPTLCEGCREVAPLSAFLWISRPGVRSPWCAGCRSRMARAAVPVQVEERTCGRCGSVLPGSCFLGYPPGEYQAGRGPTVFGACAPCRKEERTEAYRLARRAAERDRRKRRRAERAIAAGREPGTGGRAFTFRGVDAARILAQAGHGLTGAEVLRAFLALGGRTSPETVRAVLVAQVGAGNLRRDPVEPGKPWRGWRYSLPRPRTA